MSKVHEEKENKGSKPNNISAMPCYLLSLKVKDVRCFGLLQTINFADKKNRPVQWTIILGENGNGKTTLLQVLVSLENENSNIVPVNEKVGNGSQPKPRIVQRGSSSLAQSFDAFNFIRSSNQKEPTSCRLKLSHRPNLQAEELVDNHDEAFWDLSPAGIGIYYFEPPPTLSFYAYGAGRRLGRNPLVQPHDSPVATLLDEHAPLRNAEEWLLALDYGASKDSNVQSQQRDRLQQIKELLIAVLHEVEDIRFIPGSGPYPKPRVEFKTFSGWVPLRRLGYGYQTLIAWVTDFVSRMVERYPDSPDPLKEPAIVLVDEIDLHLHPVWQRKLIAFLTERFPNTQFIATAHSPLIVQAAENANIALLKRVGDHVEIINNPEEILGWRIDQILTSDLFGLQSARSPEVEALFKRKQELLAKPKQSAREKAELRAIQLKINKLPVGDSAKDAKRMETIREAIDFVKDQLPK